MTVLEQRYRSVLRLLPASYREVWEEDMVAGFLARAAPGDPTEADDVADLGRPSWREVAGVVALATRLRLGGMEAPPRPFAWGQAVRTVALVALLVQAVTAVTGLVSLLWITGVVPGLPAPAEPVVGPSAWQVTQTVAAVVWVAAYLMLVGGRRRPAQRLAILALLTVVVSAVSRTVTAVSQGWPLSMLTLWTDVLVTGLLTLALVAFRDDTPPIRRTPWLVALPVGVLLTYVPLLVWVTSHTDSRTLDWPGICCLAVIAASVVHLVGRAAGRVADGSHWSLALALLVLAVLVLRVTSIADVAWFGGVEANRDLLLGGVAEGAVVLLLGVPLVGLAARTLRRLPPVATVA
jgi:hypothetical protein